MTGDKSLAIIMVGLPARGKTYISRKIARYLTWLGARARYFGFITLESLMLDSIAEIN